MKTFAKTLVSATALAVAGTLGPLVVVSQADDMPEMHDPHAHHHMMQMPETTRHTAEYTVPNVDLVRDDGKTVALPDELNDGRPVVLNFIYTTCTAVCPLVSQTLSQLQRKLGSDRDRVHLVSISIDPEEDTPARLAAYANKYGAGPEWQHYTGTLAASVETQRAFGAYRGDKMNHSPVTYLRAAPGKPWVRIEGFATADELLEEIRSMLPSS
ncbi:MAG: SCO family protein [Sulfuricella sp.]